ncbi:hypothetical protein NQ490_04785 [Subdoligranulum variabile]|uniref:hypothetical protein n=1 Tax=Subdoligranulum variabile TaxID=214851 RepID=UPI0021A70365|nr:hypothetical protein [Subdoligranulum variabile]UWP69173.1 hypothetical protein NQ490_04785 [Subdoligranulum variabile]
MHRFKRMLAGIMATLLVLQCAPYATLAEEMAAPTAQSESGGTAPDQVDDLAAVPVEEQETGDSSTTQQPESAADNTEQTEDLTTEQPESAVDNTELTEDSTVQQPAATTDNNTELTEDSTVQQPVAESDESNSLGQQPAAVSELSDRAADTKAATVELQDGTAVIPQGSDLETVNQILFEALVVNKDQVNPEDLEWEYECKATAGLIFSNTAWGSVDGFTSTKNHIEYTHPALANNKNEAYPVRLKGQEDITVTLHKVDKNTASIELNEGVSVALPYKDDLSVDYAALKQELFDKLVASSTPSLTVDDVTITYYAEVATGAWGSWGKDWAPLEGGKVDGLTYPAISAGECDIKITYAGTTEYYGTEAQGKVTINERGKAPYALKETPDPVVLAVDENMGVDYEAVRSAIFNAVVDSSEVLTAENVTITYYTKALTDADAKYVALEGEKGSVLSWPAISAGTQRVRISWPGNQQYAPTTIDATVTVTEREKAPYELKETPDAVVLAVDENMGVDYEAVRSAIFNAVVDSSEVLTAENVTITYYTKALTDADAKYVALEGEKGSVLSWPAISAGTQRVRISWPGNQQYAPTTIDATVTVTEREKAPYELKETPDAVVLAVDENLDVDYEAVRSAIFNAVVDSSEVLTAENVTITYYTKALTDADAKYVALEGEKGSVLSWPAISAGTQKVRISWPGNQQYAPTTIDATVTVTEREKAPYELKETPDAVVLAVDENLDVDYEAVRSAIFNAVVDSSEVLTAENVTITYYTKALTDADAKYVALEGEKGSVLSWPAISAGTQKVRISWPGNQQYAPTTVEVSVNVLDREQLQFELNDGPYEVGLVFNDEQDYDYSATAAAIYNAVVSSTSPLSLSAEDVTVEYSADKTGITNNFRPLDQDVVSGLLQFGVGEWKIRISWPGNREYRGNSVTVTVNVTDNRLASSVALKSGVSFTYNMDPAVMKQEIFDYVIDWDNSTLPARETLDLDDFTIEYQAKLTDMESGVDLGLGDLGDLGDLIGDKVLTQWVPIEGKTYEVNGTVLGQYPSMGAGEAQAIRVSYKGNAEYRPSEEAESTVTVNKAKVSVTVHSTNIYADQQVPADFITMNPADKFDVYTIYAGTTSNVTTAIYLDLPDRYTNTAFLKILDPLMEKIYGKSFTQVMNDGMTLGELRDLFNTQELLDLLDKLNIDTGTFGQIMTVINKLPSVTDNLRVSFGTPNRAGLYTVGAVTDSKNYETGVGVGFLLVKMRLSGTKLTWQQDITGKMTVEQAKNFNFKAILSYNGDVSIDQSGVHYLYSGFTSKWRIYSSTTTPPTEPGSYVMTVCILGGNHFALPITRTFTITK